MVFDHFRGKAVCVQMDSDIPVYGRCVRVDGLVLMVEPFLMMAPGYMVRCNGDDVSEIDVKELFPSGNDNLIL